MIGRNNLGVEIGAMMHYLGDEEPAVEKCVKNMKDILEKQNKVIPETLVAYAFGGNSNCEHVQEPFRKAFQDEVFREVILDVDSSIGAELYMIRGSNKKAINIGFILNK